MKHSLALLLCLFACERSLPAPNDSAKTSATLLPTPPPQSELEVNSPPSEADQPFTGVFRALDGKWVGEFLVYTDSRGQRPGARPKQLDPSVFAQPPFVRTLVIQVEQEYTSESPFFQRVTIKDTYAEKNGPRTATSSGVNKVQGGKLWCLVKKSDETVIHSGTSPSKDVIEWQRDVRSPLKLEYFRETVTPESYTIIGYGYYGNDDPSLTPRTYFYAQYKRP